jgi:hypothetical protein
MKLTEEQQQHVASVWNQCQRIAAAECRARGLRGDLQRDIIDKALLQTLSAVARNDLSGDAIVSRAKSCAIDCIRVAAIAHARENVLTILVPNESGFPVTADDPLTSTDLPVLNDQQIETVNRNWHRIGSVVDVIANQFGIESGIRFQFLSAVMLETAKRIAGTDSTEISDLMPIIRETAESLVSDFCTVD